MSHVLSSGLGSLGAVTLTPEQQKLVGEPLITLANQDKLLRTMAQKLASVVGTLAQANRALDPVIISMLRKYNTAAAAQTRAGAIFLEARRNVSLADLPDPGAKPVALPTFENLPATNGLGNDSTSVKAADIAVKFGIIGQEQSRSILDFTRAESANAFAGSGLGVVWTETLTLFGLLITGIIVVWVWNSFSGNAVKIAEFDANKRVAEETTKTAQIDNSSFDKALELCRAGGGDILTCIDKATEVLRLQKTGRPQLPLNSVLENPLFTFAAIGVLGLVGWFVYRGYRRKQLARGGGRGRMRSAGRAGFPTAPAARPARPMARFAPETLDDEEI